ncbi:PTS system trehalose-specific EIIBC component [Fonticella tunisiensis]|uniref:PTS system trehalose-specific IIB component (Glc family) /PTS system trehalose-specific IIC component (Glc family) n=1 Tax=Fonticella tunisiensis TaxID=1096341 RepID=A0A4R7KCH9_9CLOT|nr:PTS system trehalose-specific EIIBC component [Fonticella tunisiensis]TDT51049.1 PTS system trehalose-specific IIB component (Glc family) /PTS system trehalose-specific IIC component (Glc family) [Fonticella tunisiensis]
MGKFSNDARQLLEYVGGKENIAAVSHCATRMRFVLRDTKKADVKKIEEMKVVKGTFTQAGQFQVIIGNEVSTFYNDFMEVSGIDGVSKEEVKAAAKNNMNFLQRLLANLAEIFAPLIPALVVGGLILGFRNVIGDIKLLEGGTKTLTQVSQFWSGVHSFLWLIGEAIFFFLPVGITWSISKKMGTTQILGIVLGITLVSPQLLNAYAVAGAKEIPVWNFGFAKVQMIGYQAQVIPAMLAGFLLAILEKNVRRIVPEYISMILVPFLALVPTVLIAHTVLGPIGWKIGAAISSVVYASLTSSVKWLFAAVFGFTYAPLVITGLHHMTNAIDLQLMGQFGGTNLWPMIALSNIAQGSAVLAIIYLHRKDEEEKQISIPATISCYLGVTEPAMFGINLKYAYPFLAAMIGSSIAAVISVGSGVMANSIGVGGIPGILSIKPQNMPMFAVAMLVAIVVPFILTIIFNKRKVALNSTEC